MLRVYKYQLPVKDYFYLTLPKGAKILAVQEQHDSPQIWALVNPEESLLEDRMFRLAGTGHPIEEPEKDLNYIGTFQLLSGNFIGHLFEIREK